MLRPPQRAARAALALALAFATAAGAQTHSPVVAATGSGGAGGITALTGDVSASGNGSVAATVNSVLGGQTPAVQWVPNPVSGDWYVPFGSYGVAGVAEGTANRQVCSLFPLLVTTTIKALGVRITTAGSGTVGLAIYTNAGGQPGAPLQTAAAQADTSTANLTFSSLTPATYTYAPGVYWGCAQISDATVALQANAANLAVAAALVGSPVQGDTVSGTTALSVSYIANGIAPGTWQTYSGNMTYQGGAYGPLIQFEEN